MVFCSRISSGPRLHVEDVGIGEQLAEQVGHGDLLGRAAVDRLADGAQRLREDLDGMMRRHVAGPEVHLRRALVVARDEAEEDLGEEALLLRAEAPHDAEVDGDEPPGVIDEQVALMHVGVEEAVAHGVLQERAHHRQAERLAIEVGGGDPVVVRKTGCRRSIPPSARGGRCASSRPRGTRKSSSPAVFSAISEMAAASRRKSISSSVERLSVSTTATGFRRRVGGCRRSMRRAAK